MLREIDERLKNAQKQFDKAKNEAMNIERDTTWRRIKENDAVYWSQQIEFLEMMGAQKQ